VSAPISSTIHPSLNPPRPLPNSSASFFSPSQSLLFFNASPTLPYSPTAMAKIESLGCT